MVIESAAPFLMVEVFTGLLTGLGFGLTGVATTAPLLVVTVVLWTFGEMIFSPVAVTYVAGVSGEVAAMVEAGRYPSPLWP
jgi:dipeptide/tripeptide permease